MSPTRSPVPLVAGATSLSRVPPGGASGLRRLNGRRRAPVGPSARPSPGVRQHHAQFALPVVVRCH